MLVKRIPACTHLSSAVYELQRDIGQKLQLFVPLAFNAFKSHPIGVVQGIFCVKLQLSGSVG